MTTQNRFKLAEENVVFFQKEFSDHPSLEVENDLKRAEWYLEYLDEQEDREDVT